MSSISREKISEIYYEVMNLKEDNIVEKSVISAFFCLMKTKSYESIMVKEIAEHANIGRRTFYRYFKDKEEIIKCYAKYIARELAEREEMGNGSSLVWNTRVYFSFWEDHLDELQLLKKSHLTYYLEELSAEIIFAAALKTKFKDKSLESMIELMTDEYLYGYYYTIAGYFKVLLLWSEENPRRTVEEIADIVVKAVER